jgi:hypothetical protein
VSRHARLAAGVASGLFAALGVALGTWVVVEGYSPVPFADFWGQIPFLERAVGGDLQLGDFWAQANEHRIFVARIQFLLDYRFFDGTNVFLFAAIAASCLVLAMTFGAAVWLETRDLLLAWGAFCAGAAAAFSPRADENLTWAFQVQFVQVFLFAAVAVLAVVVAARRSSLVWTAASALAAVAATYSMANGLLAWPIVVLLAVLLGLRRRHAVALGVVGAVTAVTYLWRLDFGAEGSLSEPHRLLAYAFVYLGSAFGGPGKAAAGLLGATGVGLFGLLGVLAWRRRAARPAAMAFGIGVGLFVVLTALQTAVGRLDLGIEQALSPRYAYSSFTFWLALVVGLLTPLRERLGRREAVGAPAYLAAAALVALVVGATSLPSRASLRADVFGKETAVLAHLAGVDDQSGTLTGGPSGAVVTDAFGWMEENDLGPWAPGGMVADMEFEPPPSRDWPPCAGAIEYVEPVGGGLRLSGRIAPPNGEQVAGNLAVFDGEGDLRGRGRVGAGFVAYARDDPPGPLTVVLIGDDRQSAVCRLETPS